jgi:hypothetical protein
MPIAIVCRAKCCHFFVPAGDEWVPVVSCPSTVFVGIDMALCASVCREGRCEVHVFNAHADPQLKKVEPHAQTLVARLSAFAGANIIPGVVYHPPSERITPARGVVQEMDAGFAWPALLVVYDGPTADLAFKGTLLGQIETEPTVAATVAAGERALNAYRALAVSAAALEAHGVQIGDEPRKLAYQWVFQQHMSAETALECLACVYADDPCFADDDLTPLACLTALAAVQGMAVVPDTGTTGVGIDVGTNSCAVCYGETGTSKYLLAELSQALPLGAAH